MHHKESWTLCLELTKNSFGGRSDQTPPAVLCVIRTQLAEIKENICGIPPLIIWLWKNMLTTEYICSNSRAICCGKIYENLLSAKGNMYHIICCFKQFIAWVWVSDIVETQWYESRMGTGSMGRPRRLFAERKEGTRASQCRCTWWHKEGGPHPRQDWGLALKLLLG